MKLVINYDLLDKAREAKSGFSFHKYAKKVGSCTAIYTTFASVGNIAGVEPPEELIFDIAFAVAYYSLFFRISNRSSAEFHKTNAVEELGALSHRLKEIFVDTDPELLTEAYKYKTEYSINFEHSIIPRIEQRKHLMVPVHSDWDNNTRSLVQEHIIGSKEYALSHGEPEKKVLTLGQKQYTKK